MTAVFPGTFDPFTKGHLDILKRAQKIFNNVTIAICASPSKHTYFSLEQRVEMVKKCVGNDENIEIIGFSGLLVDLLKDKKALYLVRGVRNTLDCEYELELTGMYRDFLPDLEIIMLPTSHEHSYISSSLIREIHKHGGDISRYVPDEIVEYIKQQ